MPDSFPEDEGIQWHKLGYAATAIGATVLAIYETRTLGEPTQALSAAGVLSAAAAFYRSVMHGE